MRRACGVQSLMRDVMRTISDITAIRRSQPSDAEAFAESVTSVARERKFLATVDDFPLSRARALLQRIADENLPQVVALSGGIVVAWCDIIPKTNVGYTHVGALAMGVLQEWRGIGLGRKLIRECLEMTRTIGLEKVELTVYADNTAAIQLYESVGFTHEGNRPASRKLDGVYQDEILMGLRFSEMRNPPCDSENN